MANILNNGVIINTDYNFAKLIDGSLTNVVIPSTISLITAYAFYNRQHIQSVKIPKSVKTINKNAFDSCGSLETITFEDNGVTTMGDSIVVNNYSLKELILPNGLITVGANIASRCYELQKIVIPSSLVNMSRETFRDCSALSYVFFKGNSPIKNSANQSQGAFYNCNNMRLFDMRYMLSAKDKAASNMYSFTSNTNYLYINVPDNLYTEFTALPNWSALNLKRWVHSCDVNSFEEIENPIDGDYYSLKGDTNYLNELGEKQIDIRQYVNGAWVEIDIDA